MSLIPFNNPELDIPLLKEPVNVRINNVLEYVIKYGEKQQGWVNLVDAFCASRLPFPEIVFSMDCVHCMAAEDPEGDTIQCGPTYHQMHIHTKEWAVRDFIDEQKRRLKRDDDTYKAAGGFETNFAQFIEPAGAYFVLEVKLYPKRGDVLRNAAVLVVDQVGNIQWIPSMFDESGIAPAILFSSDISEVPGHVYTNDTLQTRCAWLELVTVMASINFMNCRNVELIDHPPSRQQRRRAERHGEPAPVTYKTITIHPYGTRVKKNPKQGVEHDTDIPMHIVRGHFKHFRDEGGGLGKHHLVGTWWWHPRVQGNNLKRVSIREFDVKSY